MRALAVALGVALALALAGAAHADVLRTTAFGYDHTVHDRDVIVNGGDALPCARCHTVRAGKLVGKPGHAECFGACHGAPPKPPARGGKIVVEPERAKLCTSCHAEAQLAAPFTGKLPVGYPPYENDRDFGLELGHKRHAQVACTQCHTGGGKPAGAPHARCASCHDGAANHGPAMTACGTCHTPAVGKPTPPELAALHETVSATFSHAAHAKRPGGKDCLACHAAIAATDDTELPRPTLPTCATCHDGRAAFAVTEACTRCHASPPDDHFTVERPEQRFVHTGSHAGAVANRPCAACHPLGPHGEVETAGHAACAPCHADDFGARKPFICGACHNATEPWRKLVADRRPPDRTEFGATLDHAKHTGTCTACHSLRTPAAQLRTPRGHAACTGDACHAIAAGPAPHLTECAACHALGRAAAREAKRAADPWSVRARFDHAAHAGPDAPCTACHTQLAGADVTLLATPAKPTCAPCHDGARAFKLTGTGCTRCHEGRAK